MNTVHYPPNSFLGMNPFTLYEFHHKGRKHNGSISFSPSLHVAT